MVGLELEKKVIEAIKKAKSIRTRYNPSYGNICPSKDVIIDESFLIRFLGNGHSEVKIIKKDIELGWLCRYLIAEIVDMRLVAIKQELIETL